MMTANVRLLRNEELQPMASVSIKDIAARAGVSFQTVSKVLQGKGSVSQETRAWIQEVAEQLGYVPNTLARSLVSQRTGTIGVVASDFSDYVLAQVAAGSSVIFICV